MKKNEMLIISQHPEIMLSTIDLFQQANFITDVITTVPLFKSHPALRKVSITKKNKFLILQHNKIKNTT
jgi:hypothetical protein